MKKTAEWINSRWIRFPVPAILLVLLAWYGYDRYLEAQYANLYLENQNFQIQLEMYERFKPALFDVVMLGDSHTHYANWNEFLGRKNIAARGIPSDITAGYLHRLNFVYRLRPKLCFIEGGVNDVYANYTAKEIFRNFSRIVDTLRNNHITPVLQSTMFVARRRENSIEKNSEIQKLNDLLSIYAQTNSIEYLDINLLVSRNGSLRDELTYDGIHLNAAGYSLWVSEIEKTLFRHGL